jgi:hypothetical protein
LEENERPAIDLPGSDPNLAIASAIRRRAVVLGNELEIGALPTWWNLWEGQRVHREKPARHLEKPHVECTLCLERPPQGPECGIDYLCPVSRGNHLIEQRLST